MHYTRIYSNIEGESYFEEVQIPLKDNGLIGYLSDLFPVKSMRFRENNEDYNWDYHSAPSRQFIILLDGEIEITTSLGDTKIFSGGDILFVEDICGKGHKTKHTKKQIRHSIFIEI